jgi:hypothetical protein
LELHVMKLAGLAPIWPFVLRVVDARNEPGNKRIDISRLGLSAGEHILFDLLEVGARRIGKKLLAARDVADLEVRLDDTITHPDFVRVGGLLLGELPDRVLKVQRRANTRPPWVFGLLGEEARADLERVAALSRAAASAFAAPARRKDFAVAIRNAAAEPDQTVSDLIARADIPAELGRFLLAGARSTALAFAVLEVVLSDTRPKKWLGRAIAGRWAENLREYMRVLAACPGTNVPIKLVPRSERPNLKALQARGESTVAAQFRILELAREAGGAVYAPDADFGED